MGTESDCAPLETLPRLRTPKTWRRHFETLAIVASLFLGGFGTGFVYSTRTTDAEFTRLREDHLNEIDRLRLAYDTRLSSISGRVTEAADTAASAAQAAGEAAQTAKQAVTATKDLRKPAPPTQ